MSKPTGRLFSDADLDHVIFMKIGVHGEESLEDIIKRKTEDIRTHGFAYWGYGGSVGHPRNQVQELARMSDGEVTVMFISTDSNPRLAETRSSHYSANGDDWFPIIAGYVSASKWALVLSEFRPVEGAVDLNQFAVAVGSSAGKPVGEYMRGRCDKACAIRNSSLEYVGNLSARSAPIIAIGRLAPPYAVFLR